MSELNFYIECPEFGAENSYTGPVGNSKRDYAHPIDSKIIKALDTPVINAVFKSWIDFVSNTTWGTILASGIPVNEKNYPEINKIVDECSARLNIKRPYVIITNSINGINAMTFGSDEEPYIALSSLLTRIMSTNQLRFIIGHECGHIAMGHVVYHSVATAAGELSQFLPIVGPFINKTISFPLNAWSRRSEITADRAGLLCCNGDCILAKKTLLQLETAFMDADKLDVDSYVKHSDKFLSKNNFRKVGEFLNSHPLIPKRIHALDEFEKSKKFATLLGKEASLNATDDKTLEHRIEEIVKII